MSKNRESGHVLRVPPQAVGVEKHVLGAMMLDPEAVSVAMEILEPGDFYLTAHAEIFRAVTVLASRSAPTDVLSVAEELRRSRKLTEAGGEEKLLEISAEVVSSASVREHAAIVRERAHKRRQIQVATWALERAYEDSTQAGDIQEDWERRLFSLRARDASTQNLRPIREVLAESFSAIRARINGTMTPGVPTGLGPVDLHMGGGMQKGDLIVLGGRPAQGKTALCGQVAVHAAMLGHKVAFFECEMTERAIIDRALFSRAGISHQQFRRGLVPKSELRRLADASDVLAPIPFYIDGTAGVKPMAIRAKCRRLAAASGLDLIVIDNIQRMKADSGATDMRVRAAEVSEALKEIAKEFDVPVLAISHIRRLPGGDGSEPTMADLQESGNIEQNADIVMLMHRPDLYKEVQPHEQGKTKLIFAKYREGSLGYEELYFDGPLTKFLPWSERGGPDGAERYDADRFTEGVAERHRGF